MRAVLVILGTLAVLVVLAVVRSVYDDAPNAEERHCHELRTAANAVPSREDTVDDELEYLRLATAAEKACSRVP